MDRPNMLRGRLVVALAALVFCTPLVAAPPAKRATYIKPFTQNVPSAGVTQVVVENLVGPISVETGVGSDVKIEILIHGGGQDETFARTLADQLNFKVEQIAGQLRITGMYPLDHFRDYGYPHMKSVVGIHGTDSNEYQGQKVFIRDVGSDKSVELWAEIRLSLPTPVGVVIRNTYGDVTLRGNGPAGDGTLDGFTDVGDFQVYNPRWANVKLQSDYGKVVLNDGFGAAKDIHVNTDYGGTDIHLPAGSTGQIIASKDFGLLHNDYDESNFTKNSDGMHVMKLGDGNGTVVHVDMSVGSLHLYKIGGY